MPDTAPTTMSLDDLLKKQERSGKVTIEAIENQSDRVKVTPFAGGTAGCQCDASVTVPKNAIQSVTDTGEVHYCCGKTLSVVTVVWKEGAALPLTEVLADAAKRGASHSGPSAEARVGGSTAGNPAPWSMTGTPSIPASLWMSQLAGTPWIPASIWMSQQGYRVPCPFGCGSRQCCVNQVTHDWKCCDNCYTGC